MYAVELDRSKRLLVISAAQRVTAEQAKLAAKRVRELVHDIAPGFRVLADYRWLDSMDPAAARHIAEIMDAIAERRPWPPPGAGTLLAACVLAPLAGAGVAAAALVEAEVLGLNKSPRLNLPGDGDGVGCAAAVACAFFAARCFAGVGDGEGDLAGDGDCPCATQTPANPTRAMRAKIFVVIAASLTKSQDRRQSLSISVCFPRLTPLR